MGPMSPAESRVPARSRNVVKKGGLKGSRAQTGVERKEFAALFTKAREGGFETIDAFVRANLDSLHCQAT